MGRDRPAARLRRLRSVEAAARGHEGRTGGGGGRLSYRAGTKVREGAPEGTRLPPRHRSPHRILADRAEAHRAPCRGRRPGAGGGAPGDGGAASAGWAAWMTRVRAAAGSETPQICGVSPSGVARFLGLPSFSVASRAPARGDPGGGRGSAARGGGFGPGRAKNSGPKGGSARRRSLPMSSSGCGLGRSAKWRIYFPLVSVRPVSQRREAGGDPLAFARHGASWGAA